MQLDLTIKLFYMAQIITSILSYFFHEAPAQVKETCTSFPPPCHTGVTCTEDNTGRAVCGACPSGMTGNGRRCRPIVTCRDRPCYVGVTCEDTPTGM